MANTTPNLGLPYLQPQQAQKELTHNIALNTLDALAQLSVVSLTVTSPPASPAVGQRWVVAPGATGAWAGHDNQVALWAQGWVYYTPIMGWFAYAQDLQTLAHYTGSAWVAGSAAYSALSELQDTAISTPSGKDLLIYDQASSRWTNRRGTLADLGDVDLSTPAADGQFAAWVGGKLKPVAAPAGGGGGSSSPAGGSSGPAVQLLLQGYPIDGNGSSTGGPPIIRSQRGVSSIDVLAAGAIKINFSTPFSSKDFVHAMSGQFGVDATDGTGAVVYEPRRAVYNELTRGPSFLTVCGGYNASTTPFFLFLYNISIWAPPGG